MAFTLPPGIAAGSGESIFQAISAGVEAWLRARVVADGQVKDAAGFLHAVTISPLTATPTAGLLTIYDSLTETGTVVYSEWVFATTPGHTITLDVPFATGLFVGFDATLADVQVALSYR